MSAAARRREDFDDCPHCGHLDAYCDACWAAVRYADGCPRCQGGSSGWLPTKVVPRAGAVLASYRCGDGHQWRAVWPVRAL